MSAQGLNLQHVSYKKLTKTILNDITVEIPLGRLVVLLGENGVGKTTLMRVISDLNKGYQGKISLAGIGDERRKSLISYSDDLTSFRSKATLSDIIAFYQQGYPDFDLKRVNELLNFMRLDPLQRLGSLSKGNREKLIIALTLARRTKLYLLDEPLSGVDIFSRDKIISSLVKWIDHDSLLIISTHHLSELEQVIDDVLILKDQRLLEYRNVEDIRQNEGLSVEEYYRQTYLEN
ncbi:MAG: ABC transporter ATP-binding protein [Liquorilactobacillus nagelii]|jgi:ABC-2 type transport system ATP-binding protein|uniref:ATP-binding cassette domain-containing protein n=1 Tax=Liquorilactobacillus nagelii TaxID=82688 RepID=UPI00242F1DE1|nr:ABC transporter ATP-binding protein [Liquorilactobacillus nagelii]MCI1632837.1 ABC transporter ATP-binding protein [Liquorilactobacillus nagelii]MCI1922026.1 ABC transporter ATP-binding protein [Liquorilactobacillus nagelii]MCI1977413.1 ABC transporter ATP-binding protein [Liquorilactobacillus nagelii]